MTYIKKIVLNNFKSFGKKAEIPLDRNMNVFVGKNGAGKSNIADAICFVLGKLGTKSLRTESASSLIFNGGKEGKPAHQAEVEIFFDNSEKIFPSEEAEISISRTVKDDGSSIYRINNEKKTRQEILDMLAHGGISPVGFNLVLQDEVARFVEMNAEERRKIIEEVAGIAVYEERKEKSMHELEKTEEKMKEINAILRERFSYINNLEKEKQQAMKYEKLRKTIERYKATLLLHQRKEKEKGSSGVIGEIRKRETEREKIKGLLNKKREDVRILQEEIEKINKEIETVTGIAREQLYKESAALKTEIAVLNVNLQHSLNGIKQMSEREKQLEEGIKKIEGEVAEVEKQKKVMKEEMNIETFKKKIFSLLSELKEKNEIFLQELKEISSQIKALMQEKKKGIDSFENAIQKSMNIAKEINILGEKIYSILDSRIGEKRDIDTEIRMKVAEIEKSKLIIKRSMKERQEIEKSTEILKQEIEIKQKEAEKKENEEKRIYSSFKGFFDKRTKKQEELKNIDAGIFEENGMLIKKDEEVNSLKIEKAKTDTEIDVLRKEFEALNIKEEETIKASRGEIESRLARAEEEMQNIGSVNLRALEIYGDMRKEYDIVAEKMEKLHQEKQHILQIMEEIEKKKRKTFMSAFEAINKKFAENFFRITEKNSSFQLLNAENLEEAGVEIKVKIAKGKYIDTTSLSGGEKTLVALALIFAIQEYKPYHFYLLDEIDAALDKRNSERLAGLLKTYVKNAQYIIITHNDALISEAPVLYGVSIQNGLSKIFSMKL